MNDLTPEQKEKLKALKQKIQRRFAERKAKRVALTGSNTPLRWAYAPESLPLPLLRVLFYLRYVVTK